MRTEHMAPPARDPTPEDEGDVYPLATLESISTCTRRATWNITQQRLYIQKRKQEGIRKAC